MTASTFPQQHKKTPKQLFFFCFAQQEGAGDTPAPLFLWEKTQEELQAGAEHPKKPFSPSSWASCWPLWGILFVGKQVAVAEGCASEQTAAPACA